MWYYGLETSSAKQTLRWIFSTASLILYQWNLICRWSPSIFLQLLNFLNQVCPNFAVAAAKHIETIFMKIIIAMEICHYCRFEIWYCAEENHILIRADISGHPIPDEMKIEYFYAPKTRSLPHSSRGEWMCQKFKTIKKSSGNFSQLADLIYVSQSHRFHSFLHIFL